MDLKVQSRRDLLHLRQRRFDLSLSLAWLRLAGGLFKSEPLWGLGRRLHGPVAGCPSRCPNPAEDERQLTRILLALYRAVAAEQQAVKVTL